MNPGVTIPESPYATQLSQGFPGLRFIRALEREFEAEFVDQHLPRVRIGFAGGALLFAAFLLLRLRFESGPGEPLLLTARLIALGGIALPLVASAFKALRAWLPLIVPAGYGVFAMAVTASEILARRYGIDRHYEVLILATFHVYVFGGLLLRPALFGGACVFLPYLVGGALGLYGREWGFQILFLVLTHVIGAGALYSGERVERENFLRRKLYGMLATHDGLTGVLNRLAFTGQAERLLKQAAREQKGVGLVMLDIDHFKAFNDRYGHVEGDACLKAVAQAVREEFRRPLDALGRFGGEEFVGFWFDIPPQSVRQLAEQVRAAVQARRITHADAASGRITCSVGAVALVPGESETLTALIQRADRALYEAKERGRNRAVVEIVAAAAESRARSRRAPGVSGAG